MLNWPTVVTRNPEFSFASAITARIGSPGSRSSSSWSSEVMTWISSLASVGREDRFFHFSHYRNRAHVSNVIKSDDRCEQLLVERSRGWGLNEHELFGYGLLAGCRQDQVTGSRGVGTIDAPFAFETQTSGE